jgi:serine protease Do
VRGRSVLHRSLIAVTLWLVAASLQGQQINSVPAHVESSAPSGITSQVGLLSQLNSALETIVARVSPAVVQIQASGLGPLEDKDGVALIIRQHAIGSGVIVDPDGYIVTNAHVVEGAQRIRVVLPIPPAL